MSWAFRYGRWHIPDGKRLDERDIPIKKGCLDGSLSPDGALAACYQTDQSIVLFRAATGETLTSLPPSVGYSPSRIFPISLDLNTAFAGPFGYVVANDLTPLANRGIWHQPIFFSPNGEFLLVDEGPQAAGIDLRTFKRTKLPGAIEKARRRFAGIQGEDHVLLSNGGPKDPASLYSISTGELLSSFSISSPVSLASNGDYALLRNAATGSEDLLDLKQKVPVATPRNIGADVFEDQFAIYTEDGRLSLYRIGSQSPAASAEVRLQGTPLLRSVAVSPSLDKVALAVDGQGAVFDATTGLRIASTVNFKAASLHDPGSAYVVVQNPNGGPKVTRRIDLQTGAHTVAWQAHKESQLHAGGRVILDYSFKSYTDREMMVTFTRGIAYRLSGLDPASGKVLWHRDFMEDPPIPFSDPLGKYFVLGWTAKAEEARRDANHFGPTRAIFKHAKLSEQDSFFEICDSLTGKMVAGALVQFGSGPASFDSVYAVGDRLFLIKDRFRIFVVSTANGETIAQKNGVAAAASAKANLFVMAEEPGKWGIYELQTAKHLTYLYSREQLLFAHFSNDGKRLLLITSGQKAILFDIEGLRKNWEKAL